MQNTRGKLIRTTWDEFHSTLKTLHSVQGWQIGDGAPWWFENVSEFPSDIFSQAVDWYLRKAGEKFQSSCSGDIVQRCNELMRGYAPSTIVEDGVVKHLLCTIEGVPKYLAREELERKRLAYQPAEPAVPVRKFLTSRELAEKFAIPKEGPSQAELQRRAEEQRRKLREKYA